MSSHVLGDKDVNAAIEQQQLQTKDVKSMDYHRQVFQSKMAQEPYVYRKHHQSCSSASSVSSSSASASASTASSSSSSFGVFVSRDSAPDATATTTNTNSSDASSCFSSSSASSPVPSLISDSSSARSASPAPSITAMPRWPANKTLVASTKQYVSPSDNIMSPCTAKINALRNKHVSKYVFLVFLAARTKTSGVFVLCRDHVR